MTGQEIAIGSRGSKLALVQARLVMAAFSRAGMASRIVIVETEGDRRRPDTAWGEGAFVTAIELALLDGRVDVAVHSAKDLPTDVDERLRVGAYLPRADPRDALVVGRESSVRCLDDLPAGARIGTDSPRRTGFLLARRRDLNVHPLHGNVDTRLGRLDAGQTDALVLACAGLDRLGLGGRISERLAADVVPPAPGQGAIAVQIRADDVRSSELSASIDHDETRLVVEAERAFLRASGGGCRAPIGALATLAAGRLELLGGYARADGSATALIRRGGSAGDGEALAGEVADALEADFGRAAGPAAEWTAAGHAAGRVIVTRAEGQVGGLLAALETAGLEPVPVPAIAIELRAPGGELDEAAAHLDRYAWVVVTSANGARAILDATRRVGGRIGGPRWAAIGDASAAALESAGSAIDFRPAAATSRAVAAELPLAPGERVLVVRGDLAGSQLAESLRARGAAVDEVLGYRTVESPPASRALLPRAMSGPIDAIVFTSGSTVRGLVGLARAGSFALTAIPAICAGPSTATAAREAGFSQVVEAAGPGDVALARAAAETIARRRTPFHEETR